MTVDVFVDFVNTIGFPIACVVALFLKMNKQEEAHKLEIDKLSEALNNNTLVMTKICEKLGVS